MTSSPYSPYSFILSIFSPFQDPSTFYTSESLIFLLFHTFSYFPPYTFSYLLLFTRIIIISMYSHTCSILYPSHLSIIFNFLQPITTKNHNYLLISPICCGPPSGLTVGKTQPAMLDKKGQLIHNYRNFLCNYLLICY